MKTTVIAAFLGISTFWSAGQTATLIDNSTQGYSNSGLGTVLDGTSAVFPIANGAGGDPSINIPASAPPNLSAAAGSLGT